MAERIYTLVMASCLKLCWRETRANRALTSLLLPPQVLPLQLLLQPRSSSRFPPRACQPENTDHPVRLFTLSFTVSLLPRIAGELEDWITRQECPLVFVLQSVHHFHLSTLQPFSLPAMIVCLELVPTVMHPEMSASKWFSSKQQQAWAHRRSLPCLRLQPPAIRPSGR